MATGPEPRFGAFGSYAVGRIGGVGGLYDRPNMQSDLFTQGPLPSISARPTYAVDANLLHEMLSRLSALEVWMGELVNDKESKRVSGRESADHRDIDGLAALRDMNREAEEAIAQAAVVVEDTQRFLDARRRPPRS